MLDLERLLINTGARVKKLREDRGLSRTDLADLINMEYNNLERIERGGTNCTVRTLMRIANGLNVPMCELFK